jgi:hypothetical protein
MAVNDAPTAAEVERRVVAFVRDRLPSTWTVAETTLQSRHGSLLPDMQVESCWHCRAGLGASGAFRAPVVCGHRNDPRRWPGATAQHPRPSRLPQYPRGDNLRLAGRREGTSCGQCRTSLEVRRQDVNAWISRQREPMPQRGFSACQPNQNPRSQQHQPKNQRTVSQVGSGASSSPAGLTRNTSGLTHHPVWGRGTPRGSDNGRSRPIPLAECSCSDGRRRCQKSKRSHRACRCS